MVMLYKSHDHIPFILTVIFAFYLDVGSQEALPLIKYVIEVKDEV